MKTYFQAQLKKIRDEVVGEEIKPNICGYLSDKSKGKNQKRKEVEKIFNKYLK